MMERRIAAIQAAADILAELIRAEKPPAEIMATLVRDHGARLTVKAWTNTFRFGGLSASCTWSADKGLYENWRKTATLRLMAAQLGGAGAER